MQGDTMPLGAAAGGPMLKTALRQAAVQRSEHSEAGAVSAQPPSLTGNHPPRRRARIVFVLMSAVARPATVDQLARALAPHTVLVHHDFSQAPEFSLSAPNVRFVPDPVRTGWAQFGFVEGIFHALTHAVEALDFDYLQLLSPSCLPIKPLVAFEHHVSGLEEAHFDALELAADRDVRLSVGYRAWTSQGSPMHRLMRRLVRVHFGPHAGRRDEAGVWVHTGQAPGVGAQLAGLALQALQSPLVGRHMRGHSLPLYYGSTWFGARRHIVLGLVRAWRQPALREHFSRVRIAEEFLVPSLLMRLHPHKGPLNHLIQRFDQAHPGRFELPDLERLAQSRAFFARKFADDPEAPVRHRVLTELAGCTAEALVGT